VVLIVPARDETPGTVCYDNQRGGGPISIASAAVVRITLKTKLPHEL
jgi:hypothetical protein